MVSIVKLSEFLLKSPVHHFIHSAIQSGNESIPVGRIQVKHAHVLEAKWATERIGSVLNFILFSFTLITLSKIYGTYSTYYK